MLQKQTIKIYVKRKDRKDLSRLVNIAFDRESLVYKRIRISELLYTYFIIQTMTKDGVYKKDNNLQLLSRYIHEIDRKIIIRIAKREMNKNRSNVYNVFLHYIIVFGGL